MTKAETPETLRELVDTAVSLLSTRVAGSWKHKFDRNRVKFEGYGMKFHVRDRNGMFTISYEHMPGKFATKHCQRYVALRLMLDLFHRPPEALG